MESGDKSGDKYNEDSIMPPIVSLEETNALDYGHESDDEPMPTEMLEDICDGRHYHPDVNRREAQYKIRDCFKQKQSEWNVALKVTRNMGKGSHKLFKIW